MGDTLRLTFTDGTKERIDVPAGRGEAEVEELLARTGTYKSGWIRHGPSNRAWLNLATVILLELEVESD